MASSKSRYSIFSPNFLSFKNKSTKEIVSSPEWNAYCNQLISEPARVLIVPAGFEGRPDLISYEVYGIVDYWWVICAANNIIDPFEQLLAGKQIRIPIIIV